MSVVGECCASGVLDASGLCCASGKLDTFGVCDGIDALFIGRGDLAVSMQAAGSDAPEVWAAARTIAQGAAAHDKTSWAFAAGWGEADRLLGLGVRTIIIGSDQSHLKAGASTLAAQARRRKTSKEKAEI